jgi:hypothetical protein
MPRGFIAWPPHNLTRIGSCCVIQPNPDWFVLRDAGNPEEPFTHVTQLAGLLTLETSVPFRDLPLRDLQSALSSQTT